MLHIYEYDRLAPAAEDALTYLVFPTKLDNPVFRHVCLAQDRAAAEAAIQTLAHSCLGNSPDAGGYMPGSVRHLPAGAEFGICYQRG